jgi:hypothetical protein
MAGEDRHKGSKTGPRSVALLLFAGAVAIGLSELTGGCFSSSNNSGKGGSSSSGGATLADASSTGSSAGGQGSSSSTGGSGSGAGTSGGSGSSGVTASSTSSGGSSSSGGELPCVDPGDFCMGGIAGPCCANPDYLTDCNAYRPGQSYCYISGDIPTQPFCLPASGTAACSTAADAAPCCGDSVCTTSVVTCFSDAGCGTTGACLVIDGGYCDQDRPCATGLTCYGTPSVPQSGSGSGPPPPPGWGGGPAGTCRPACASNAGLVPGAGGTAFCCPGNTPMTVGSSTWCMEGCIQVGGSCPQTGMACCGGTCAAGMCTGNPVGTACTFGDQCVSADCDPVSGFCCTGVGEGEYPCTKDSDCCGGSGAVPLVMCQQGACCYPPGHGCAQGGAADPTCCSGQCDTAGQCL